MTEQLIPPGNLPPQCFDGVIYSGEPATLEAALRQAGDIITIPGPGNCHPGLMPLRGLRAVAEIRLQSGTGKPDRLHAYWASPPTDPNAFPFEEEVEMLTGRTGRQSGFILVGSQPGASPATREITGLTFVSMAMNHGIIGDNCNMPWLTADGTLLDARDAAELFGHKGFSAPNLTVGQQDNHLLIWQGAFYHPITIWTEPTEAHRQTLQRIKMTGQPGYRIHPGKIIAGALRGARSLASFYPLSNQ